MLARAPAASRTAIVDASRIVNVPSRALIMREGDPERVVLIVSGLVRMFRTTDDGRELTIVWARPTQMIGLASIVIPPLLASAQAVTDTIGLELPVPLLKHQARTVPAVTWGIAEHSTSLLRRAVDEILLYAYGDLRQRVSYRLLELACKAPPDGPLIASLTQDDLAQSVGATRPAVARVLKDLRNEGYVRSLYGGILIERPDALAAAS